jgi:predicted porin
MKKNTHFKKLSVAALVSVTLGSSAFAQDDATDAKINALKSQIGQLTQQVNDLSSRSNASASSSGSGVKSRFKDTEVSLFGSFDMYYEHQKTGKETMDRLVSSGSGYSLLGVSATKNIGNGTTVYGDARISFQSDNGKAIGDSGTKLFTTSWVGISNQERGTLQLGRQGTQMGEALGSFRLIRLGTANFIYHPANTLTHANMVKYISPKFNNLQASGSVDFPESTTAPTSTGRSAMLKYDDGKTVALGGVHKSNAALDLISSKDTVTVTSYGAQHNLGFMSPFAVVQTSKSNMALNRIDLQAHYYGIDFPVGPGTLRVEGETLKNNSLANSNAKSKSVRYDWKLDPSTTIYFVSTKIDNEAKVYYPIVGTGGWAATPVALGSTQNNQSVNTNYNGLSPSSLAVGIKVDF